MAPGVHGAMQCAVRTRGRAAESDAGKVGGCAARGVGVVERGGHVTDDAVEVVHGLHGVYQQHLVVRDLTSHG